MPLLTPAAVRRQIESGKPDPVYLLVGEDEVEKAALADDFAALVEAPLRPFNVERIVASEMTTGDRIAEGIGSLVAAVHTLPMMAPRRVVVVAQAEALLVPRRESEAAERALARLEALLKEPDPQTTLVFVVGSLDRRSRMYKLLVRHATVVDCGTIENLADAQRWIRTHVARKGAEIAPDAAALLASQAGVDIRRLRNDVDRLLLYALGQKKIGVDDVRQIAGPAALQDDWAILNALEARDAGEALRQLALLLDAGAPPEKVLGQIGWFVRTKFPEIAPAALVSAVESLFETDLALKRSAGNPRMLLERLVIELCPAKRPRGPAPRLNPGTR